MKQLTESNKQKKKEYGYSFIKLDVGYTNYIKHLHKKINKEHICKPSYQEPHLTILHGYGNVNKNFFVNNLITYKPRVFKINIYDVDVFKNECDVLVLRCQSPELLNLRKHMEKIPHTKTFKDYKPHITIAYLKPGYGEVYKHIIKSKLKKGSFKAEYIYYTNLYNNTIRFKLKNKDK